jgi:hypothetical protein
MRAPGEASRIAPLGWAIRYQFRAAVGSLILAQYAGKAAGMDQAGLPPWRPSDGAGCGMSPHQPGACFGFSDRAAHPVECQPYRRRRRGRITRGAVGRDRRLWCGGARRLEIEV